ncbi:hypothetical protein CFP59_09464 [Streptomyces malaysiensis subsp. malaysiensis]|nr:hypothetical protein CFP59_09464 [Streptomyces sp. M56]
MARQAATESLPYAVDRPTGDTLDLSASHAGRVVQRNTDAFEYATLVRLGESLGIPGADP